MPRKNDGKPKPVLALTVKYTSSSHQSVSPVRRLLEGTGMYGKENGC